MNSAHAERPLQRFLVELVRPVTGWNDLRETVSSARAATAGAHAEGVPVRFLRSVFVPEDDACFLLVEGTSAAEVAAVIRGSVGPVADVRGTVHVE